MTAGLINKYSQKMARNVKYLSLLKNLICSPGAWLQNFLMLTNFFSATVLVCFQGNKCTYTTLHTFLIIKFYNLPGSFVLFFLSLSLPFSLNGQLLNLLVFFFCTGVSRYNLTSGEFSNIFSPKDCFKVLEKKKSLIVKSFYEIILIKINMYSLFFCYLMCKFIVLKQIFSVVWCATSGYKWYLEISLKCIYIF